MTGRRRRAGRFDSERWSKLAYRSLLGFAEGHPRTAAMAAPNRPGNPTLRSRSIRRAPSWRNAATHANSGRSVVVAVADGVLEVVPATTTPTCPQTCAVSGPLWPRQRSRPRAQGRSRHSDRRPPRRRVGDSRVGNGKQVRYPLHARVIDYLLSACGMAAERLRSGMHNLAEAHSTQVRLATQTG
jgi:hypothetical protein